MPESAPEFTIVELRCIVVALDGIAKPVAVEADSMMAFLYTRDHARRLLAQAIASEREEAAEARAESDAPPNGG
ncbi:MAG: hypothetical protein QME96_08235 [Myxococcota bacterium]|nr:hypothetical protein [Myxococcota bacterium]